MTSSPNKYSTVMIQKTFALERLVDKAPFDTWADGAH